MSTIPAPPMGPHAWMEPQFAPEPPPPPRRRVTWPLVVGGVALLVFSLVMMAGAAFVFRVVDVLREGHAARVEAARVAAQNQDPQGVTTGAPTTAVSLKTAELKAPTATFLRPNDWKVLEANPNRVTVTTDGEVVEPLTVLAPQEADGVPIGMIEYKVTEPTETPPDQAELRKNMSESAEEMRAWGPADLLPGLMEEGCLDNARYAVEPRTVTQNGLIAMRYDFQCDGYGGARTGSYIVGFSQDGRIHRFMVVAVDEYWASLPDQREQLITSLKPTA